MLEHTKRQVSLFFFPETRLYLLTLITAVSFLFLLKLKWSKLKNFNETNEDNKAKGKVYCLKQGSVMNNFCLKHDDFFNGPWGTPLPKHPVGAFTWG